PDARRTNDEALLQTGVLHVFGDIVHVGSGVGLGSVGPGRELPVEVDDRLSEKGDAKSKT
ncbi:hypothetical protein MKL09_13720, partial [Methylobacterium sp. J-048]|uniref:hypothetical protein n=1 Tax=Methylobacterium sp. J-048 TaxID=2836635 RepID=UPI001FBA35F0